MPLKIPHETDLACSAPIRETVMELRMAPRQEQDQHRLSFRLAIGPAAPVTGYFDWLGNLVHAFTINAFHERIRIVATSVVETDRPAIDVAGLAGRWPIGVTGLGFAGRGSLRVGGSGGDGPGLRGVAESAKPGAG